MTDRFLSRWSRRKAATRDRPITPAATTAPELPTIVADRPEPEPVIEPTETTAEVEASEATVEEDVDQETLDREVEELGLPSLDSLGPGSDFKAFMQAHVPSRIRTLALRKLWGSNPVLANLDGLIDYGEDFTDKALAVANLQTAYQVGKGYNFDPDPEEDALEDAETEDVAELEEEEPSEYDGEGDAEGRAEDRASEDPDDGEDAVVESGSEHEPDTIASDPEIDPESVTKETQTA